MTGDKWPPLVPDPPGQEGKLAAIMPKFPSTDKKSSGSQDKAVVLEAGSLNSAYHKLDQLGLQPVPAELTYLWNDNPKMKVFQDDQKLDWHLMRVAVPRPRDNVMEGTKKEEKALDGPNRSSVLCPGIQMAGEKTVTTVKKKGRKKMTSAKKVQLQNRSLFCGPMKPKKKKKGKKSKVGRKDAQGPAVPPEVDHLYFLSYKYVDLLAQEPPVSEKRKNKRKGKKKEPRKVPRTLDLSAEVIEYSTTNQLYHNLSFFQPIDVSHIFVADKHEQPQRRRTKILKDNVVVQVDNSHMITLNLNHFLSGRQQGSQNKA